MASLSPAIVTCASGFYFLLSFFSLSLFLPCPPPFSLVIVLPPLPVLSHLPKTCKTGGWAACQTVQLRVVKAFKSTLEDMEDQRSIHSLHSLHSSRSHPGGARPMSDISFIDEDAKSPSPQSDQLLPPPSAAALVAAADISSPKHIGGGNGRSTSAREALLFLRRGPSLNSGNHMPSSQEFAPLVAERSNSSAPATPRSPLSASSSSSSTSASSSAAAPDNNNRASFSNPLTQGYNLLAEPPVNKLHETSI